MKNKLSRLFLVSLGLALPASAATYNYYLQMTGASGGFGAWTGDWQSDTLTPPACPGGIVTSSGVGVPQSGYTLSISYCSSGGAPILIATWTNSSFDQIIYSLGFSAADPPLTTGVFNSASDGFSLSTPEIFVGPVPGPPATLTITKAISIPPVPHWLGSILRVSLTVAGPVTPPPGVPVEAIVGFTDTNGNPIGQSTTVPIIAGQVASVLLNTNIPVTSATSITALGQHTEIIPVVSAPEGQILPPLQLTAEVLDGVTGFGEVLTTATGLAPPPASLAPQGLAWGQTMRLTATAAFPPNPCDAVLSFAKSNGGAIGQSLSVSLSPGQSKSLDLTSAEANVGLGSSMIVQPKVTLQAPVGIAAVPSPACVVSSDVFDQILGRTWTYQAADVQ